MIVRYIKRVRRADPAVRTRHAFFWAVGITSVAAVLWVMTLPSILRPLPDTVISSDAPRPWTSFFARAKEQLAAVGGAIEDVEPNPTTPEVAPATSGNLELTPEALAEARARAAIDYVPVLATTSSTTSEMVGTTTTNSVATSTSGVPPGPRVVRIATTTSPVATTTATTTR